MERTIQEEKEPWATKALDASVTTARNSDLHVENYLVIGGTQFKHRPIHKTTWGSPDGNTVSQIDHVIITQKWRRSLQDVVSDHVLVVATLSLKAKRGEER